MCLTGNGTCKGGKCTAGMTDSTEICPSLRKRAEASTSNRRNEDRRKTVQAGQEVSSQSLSQPDRREGDRRKPKSRNLVQLVHNQRRETGVAVPYSVGAIASASAISSSIASAASAGSEA
jgi:hypothetical protein